MIVMPDYIFLDVNMPVMNGKQFLQEIKKTNTAAIHTGRDILDDHPSR